LKKYMQKDIPPHIEEVYAKRYSTAH